MMRAAALIAMLAAAAGAATDAAAFEVAQVIGPSRIVLPVGKLQQVAIEFAVKPGYHVQANPAAYPNLIPTRLTLLPVPGVAVGKPRYPAAKRMRLEGSGEQLLVYDGRFRIVVPMARYAPAAARIRLEGSLRYQGCDDRHCLFPETLPVALTVEADGP
jgi:DsbC/DsbD-like thiol-disulfide interchange protein